jgi:hypothetical protein
MEGVRVGIRWLVGPEGCGMGRRVRVGIRVSLTFAMAVYCKFYYITLGLNFMI